MKLVIVGAGKVGETLVAKLTKENHDIIVVDEDPKAVDTVVNRYDARGIVGNGGERSILLNAECDTADFFVACTSRDELNLLCCVLAKKLGAKHTMARVRDPEYFNERDTLGEELEVDMLFNPEYRIAVEIAQLLRFPSAINIETFAGGKIAMIELRITEKNPIVGKSLVEIAQTYDSKVLFCMVTRGDSVVTPRFEWEPIDKKVVTNTRVFFICWFALVGLGTILLSLDGFGNLLSNLIASLTCISNTGPGLDLVGPTCNFSGYSYFSKIVLSVLMLAGRLEIFPVLVLFAPSTWKKH